VRRERELASSVGGAGQPTIERDEGTSRRSARARYHASYADNAWRSAQTREAKGSNGQFQDLFAGQRLTGLADTILGSGDDGQVLFPVVRKRVPFRAHR